MNRRGWVTSADARPRPFVNRAADVLQVSRP